ncbi:MAG TPA: hypothetical protein VF671_15725 [Pseudomonas sp.]|uniref:hypothetical protein n=1 Tax=Pseudomonas sp. TaxID=306 RepID=UPI002EDB3DE4
MNARIIACLAALLVAVPALAEKKSYTPNAWPKEPDSFMGIKFTSDIESDFPSCASLDTSRPTNLCYQKTSTAKLYKMEGKPDIGLSSSYEMLVKVRDGDIDYINLSVKSRDYEKLSDMFINKYGPAYRDRSTVTTGMGVELENESLHWSGRNIFIMLQKYDEDINSGTVVVGSLSAMEKANQERKQQSSQGASKL